MRKFDYQKVASVLVATLSIFLIISVVFLFVPPPKQIKASDTIEQTATGMQTMNTSNPVTMAFDCNEGNLLVVELAIYLSATGVGTPTYNGVSMTASPEGTVTKEIRLAQIWYLVNPSVGSNTISIPNTSNQSLAIFASAWSGVDASDPLDISKSDTGHSGTPAVNITTSAAGELIIDIMHGNTITGNNHTLINYEANRGSQYTLNDGSSGITLEWTMAESGWAMIVCAFNAYTPQNNDPPQNPNILPKTGADLY